VAVQLREKHRFPWVPGPIGRLNLTGSSTVIGVPPGCII
jgi:hypothetical protein